MPRFDFDVVREKKRNHFDRSKAIRLIFLFCVIAAITALVIYAIIPESEMETAAAGQTTQETAETAASPESAEPEKPGSDGERQSGSAVADISSSASTALSGKASAAETAASPAAAAAAEPKEKSAKYNPSDDELYSHTRQLRRQLADGSWKNAPFAVSYTVRSGDRVINLAKTYHTTGIFIRQANALDDNATIRINQKLFFINAPGGWSITVSRSKQNLQIDRIVDGQAVAFAALRCNFTSRKFPAELVVCQRIAKPVYKDDQGRIFKNGTPGNPYGDYRITMASPGAPNNPILHFSIHDAGDNEALTAVSSDGSITMSPDDIQLLYTLIPEGTPIRFTE